MRAFFLSIALIATLLGLPVSTMAAAVSADCEHCAEMLASDNRCDDTAHGCVQCPPVTATAVSAPSQWPTRSGWHASLIHTSPAHQEQAPPLPPPIVIPV